MGVWDDVADTRAEAEILRVRSALMSAVRERIEVSGWSQPVAAVNLGVTEPRVAELMGGRISRFDLEDLVALAERVGVHVAVVADSDPEV